MVNLTRREALETTMTTKMIEETEKNGAEWSNMMV